MSKSILTYQMVLNLKIVPKVPLRVIVPLLVMIKNQKKNTKISFTGSEPEIINFLYVDPGEVN